MTIRINFLRPVVFTGLFLVPFVPFLVSSSLFFPFIVTKAFAWRIIVEIIFAAWVILAISDANYRPKKSSILYAVITFLAIIGIADLFGVAPMKSFWSNFERMEGFIAMLHLGMFFTVVSSVFKELDWKRWWNTSLVASFLMVLFCFLQLLGLKTINQGGVRVDGTLGNAIYLAVYMLFHIFIATLFLLREWKNVALRWVYGLLILLQTVILYFTATRGAILGLLGGLLIIALLNIRNNEAPFIRKAGVALLAGLVILFGGFFLVKDAQFVQNSPVLSRFSSLNTEELKTQGRYFVWPMAIKGVKERPILGWGQENFGYIFQKHYDPKMYKLEPWFDRAHNIFLDWAVAGGILGLIAYLSLYLSLLYLIWKNREFSHAEKSVFVGLVAAYFFHNFFVFDHLISYILFFSLLAYAHHRSVETEILEQRAVSSGSSNFALPITAVVLVLVMYFVNARPIVTNFSLIQALKSVQIPGAMNMVHRYLERAFNSSRLGRQEVLEQIVSNSIPVLTSNLSIEEKNSFYNFAQTALLNETDDLKNDARYQLVVGTFFATTGSLDMALSYLEQARVLSPNKQMIHLTIADVLLNKGEKEKAIEILRYVGEISPDQKEEMEGYIRQIRESGN